MKLEINIVVHHHRGATEDELRAIRQSLVAIKETIMGMKEDYEAGFAKIDTATTAIAARIQAYIDQVNAGGMTPEEEAAGLARLGSLGAALEAMGANPANPVPEPVPEP